MQFADGQKSLFITDYFANLVIKSFAVWNGIKEEIIKATLNYVQQL